jgi:hypothetical protein
MCVCVCVGVDLCVTSKVFFDLEQTMEYAASSRDSLQDVCQRQRAGREREPHIPAHMCVQCICGCKTQVPMYFNVFADTRRKLQAATPHGPQSSANQYCYYY